MRTRLLNWSNAKEILQYSENISIYNFIIETVQSAPNFIFEGKSESSSAGERIDTCQEHLNRYFDYKIHADDWELQPSISLSVIEENLTPISLKADFRKEFNNRVFQIEIQCGNNSRFYADLFKFQMAWLQKLTDVAILIVPLNSFAIKMGENICNFERLERELPYLRPVLQLPILVIGFEPDSNTQVYDLKQMSYNFLNDSNLTEKKKYSRIKSKINKDRNIQALIINEEPIESINEEYSINGSIIPS